MDRVVIYWNKEAIQRYKENTGALDFMTGQEASSVEEKWQKLKEGIHGAIMRKKIKIKKKN